MTARSLPTYRSAVIAALVAVVGVLLVAGPLAERASAAPTIIHVTNAGDFVGAIAAVNDTTNGSDTVADDYTIILDNDIDYTGTGGVTLATIGTDEHNVVIDGAGFALTCDDGAGSCGFLIQSYMGPEASLTFRDITVSGFRAGAVYLQDSALTIDGSEFSDNTITGDSDSSSAIWGGAIQARGYYFPPDNTPVEIIDSVFSDNTASAGNAYGGAVYLYLAEGVITNSEFVNNEAEALSSISSGGAVAASNSALTVSGSTFEGNAASAGPDAGYGGAIGFNDGTMLVSDAEFTENSSSGYGGAIYANRYSVTTTVTANGLTTFTDNSSRQGGAVASQGASVTTNLDTTVFDGNTAVADGGALWVQSGIGNVTASLFTDNSAEHGGAITSTNGADVNVSQATFTGNAASVGGAVLHTWASARFDVVHATIAGNTVPAGNGNIYEGGQILNTGASTVDLFASVVVDTLGGGVACSYFSGQDPTSSGYNYVDDTTCNLGSTGDSEVDGADPELGDLESYGGPTQVMVPDVDGPLIDKVLSGSCISSSTDQRGVARPQGDGCDIGAVEQLEPISGSFTTPGGEVWVRILNAVDAEGGPVSIASLTPAPPAGVAFPYGAMELGIEVWDDGWPADIQFFSPAPTTQLWKLFDGEWVEPPGATHENGEGGTLWTFRVTDGGFGDNDGEADSFIVDPSALGVAASFTG